MVRTAVMVTSVSIRVRFVGVFAVRTVVSSDSLARGHSGGFVVSTD